MTSVSDLQEAPDLPSVRYNLAYAAIGRGFHAITQFAVIVLAARIGGPEDVGALTLATAVVTPLYFLTAMGMREVHSVDDLTEYSRNDYVALRILGSLLAVLMSALIALIWFGEDGWHVEATIIAFAILRFFTAQTGLVQGIFQREERLDYVAWSIFARCSIGLAVFAATYVWTRDLPTALAVEAVSWFVTYHLIDRRMLVRLGAYSTLRELWASDLRQLGTLALWMLPIGISLWFTRAATSVPTVVLEHHAGLKVVGLFGALAYVHTAMAMFATAVTSATAARLRRFLREGNRPEFMRLVGRLMAMTGALGLAATALAWFFGNPILTLVFGPDYAERDLFTVIVAGSALGLLAAPLVTAILAAQAFRTRLAVGVASFAAGSVVGLLLIPSYGAMGAAIAFGAVQAAHLGGTLLACRTILAYRGDVGPLGASETPIAPLDHSPAEGAPHKIVAAIVTVNRRAIVRQTLDHLCRLSDPPDRLILSVAQDDDYDADQIAALPFPTQVIVGPRGSSVQRNRIRDHLTDDEIVLFLDDDFLVADGYIAATRQVLAQNPDVALVTGTVLADGILGPGLTHGEGAQLLTTERGPVVGPDLQDTRSGYGCNMAVRARDWIASGAEFDERLVLYSWLEDFDFSRQMLRQGRVVKSSRMQGVHLGTKTGRVSDRRLGYIQIANPIYLWRKGTMPPRHAMRLVSRMLTINTVKSFWSEAHINRRARLWGNLRALGDLVLGRLEPGRVLSL